MKNYNEYIKAKKQYTEEYNRIPMFFAFTDKQFEEGLKEYQEKYPDLIDEKIYNFGAGVFGSETTSKLMRECSERYYNGLKERFKTDVEFFKQAIDYELSNNEYIITYDCTDTLDALRIDEQFIIDNNLETAFKEAKRDYLKSMERLGY